MTIIEALQSGKPFRRPGGMWLTSSQRGQYYGSFTEAEVLATDWEIKQEPKTIYCVVLSNGSLSAPYDSLEQVKQWRPDYKIRKFVEVIE